MPQFQIEDKTLDQYAKELCDWGQSKNLNPEELALVLHITSEILMKSLDMHISSSEIIPVHEGNETEH